MNFFFDYIKDNRIDFFTSNNRAPKSHAGIDKETRLFITSGWSESKAEQPVAEGPVRLQLVHLL